MPMAFSLEKTPHFVKTYGKAAKKNPELKNAVEKKVVQILEDPYRFKPMRKPLQGTRRVHIMRCFVLLYLIKEKENTVVLTKIEHHDNAYG